LTYNEQFVNYLTVLTLLIKNYIQSTIIAKLTCKSYINT